MDMLIKNDRTNKCSVGWESEKNFLKKLIS